MSGTIVFGSRVESTVKALCVAVIEQRVLVRELLLRAFRASGMTTEALNSIDEYQNRAKSLNADLILLSVAGFKREEEVRKGVAMTSKLTNALPVVILSDDVDTDHVVHALEMGASGYVTSEMPFAVVIEALRLVRAGGTYAPTRSLISNAKRHDSRGAREVAMRGGSFTPRQAAVIEALRRGKSNKIIAYELNMCESTVKVHVRNIMKRLHAKNRTEVAYLTQSGTEGGR